MSGEFVSPAANFGQPLEQNSPYSIHGDVREELLPGIAG